MNESARYRIDIQVMRAVAVLAVVAFHYQPDFARGGYLGVDIFFVISGYLISGQIVSRLEAGTWSFQNFYARRIRRLYPALLCTLLGCTIAAFLILPPHQTVDYAWSAISALFGVSNFYFFLGRDYFSPAAHVTPLLHTWSLGVEEQFYLVWPLLVLLAFRIFHRKGVAALTVALMGLSVLAAAIVESLMPEAVFYLLPFRAFELLAGALVYLGRSSAERIGARWPAVIVGWCGLLAVFIFTTSRGLVADMAVSTALISALLWLNPNISPLLARFLLPLRYVGDISYSLYLVHWPVLVFARLDRVSTDPSLEFALLLFSISMALAAAQYHVVEDPIRRGRRFIFDTSQGVVKQLGAAAAVLVTVLVSGPVTSGWMFRVRDDYAANILKRAATIEDIHRQYDRPNCFRERDYGRLQVYIDAGCIRGSPARINIVLLGDSLAAHYSESFRTASEKEGWTFSQITAGSCVPALEWNDRRDIECGNLIREAVEFLERSPAVDVVIISGNYFNHRLQRVRLAETARRLAAAGRTVIVLGPAVRYDAPLPSLLVKYARGNTMLVDEISKHLLESQFENDRSMRRDLAGTGAAYLSVIDVLCIRRPRSCRVLHEDAPIQRDGVHLSKAGADLVTPAVVKRIALELGRSGRR